MCQPTAEGRNDIEMEKSETAKHEERKKNRQHRQKTAN